MLALVLPLIALSLSTLALGMEGIDPLESRCFTKGAEGYLIYLHSLDDPGAKDSHFHKNLKILEQFATERQWTIYVPRSKSLCQSKLCWPQGSSQQARDSWSAVRAGSSKCFSAQLSVKPSAQSQAPRVLGFSNGGFLVNKLAVRCLETNISQWVSVGSHLEAEVSRSDKICGELTLAVGRKDISFAKAKESAEKLNEKLGRRLGVEFAAKLGTKSGPKLSEPMRRLIRFYPYEGAHEISLELLRSVL